MGRLGPWTAPKALRDAFLDQRAMAKRRGIPFLLSFHAWLAIWEGSGHLHERGRKRGQYVMARRGDTGPYALGNVEIITHSENSRMASLGNTNMVGKVRSAETPSLASEGGHTRKKPSARLAKHEDVRQPKGGANGERKQRRQGRQRQAEADDHEAALSALMWSDKYIACRYDRNSFKPPALHCVGLFLTIVRERKGVEIPYDDVSAESIIPWVHAFDRAQKSPDWVVVACMKGEFLQFEPFMCDQECDLVVMSEIVGSGYRAKRLGMHCGTVIEASRLIDISEDQGVKVKRYYDTMTAKAHGETKRSVISVLRHRLLA